uniref:Uncharacterized protein n=1 Tax=Paramoeba aestuarina TaxID=180227 RepID=A0A7S4NDD3_9EUKA|mmetsp:Transcript_14719/g.22999  ORF Transcript_14719/g.22999 Transcript_14719/m.22999 type:complete len:518 (+) Transcript_14719:126-1679(+)
MEIGEELHPFQLIRPPTPPLSPPPEFSPTLLASGEYEYDENEQEGRKRYYTTMSTKHLHAAIWSRDMTAIRQAASITTVHFRDQYERSALHIAIFTSNLRAAQLILKLKGDPFLVDHKNKSCLCVAVMTAQWDIIETILQETEAPLDQEKLGKDSSTMWALLRRVPKNERELSLCTQLMERMLDGSGMIFLRNSQGETPLHVACVRGSIFWARFLLKHGALLDIQNNQKETPLHLACFAGHGPLVTLLLNEGANMYILDSNDNLPVEIAHQTGRTDLCNMFSPVPIASPMKNLFFYACRQGDYKRVKQCLRDSREVLTEKDWEGMTGLLIAASCGHVRIVKLLLDQKEVNPVAVNRNGMNVLHFLARKLPNDGEDFEIITKTFQIVHEKGVAIESVNSKGETPLHLAALSGNVLIVDIFIASFMAPCNAVTTYKDTPLHYAVYGDHASVATRLVELVGKPIKEMKNVFGLTAVDVVYTCDRKTLKLLWENTRRRGSTIREESGIRKDTVKESSGSFF